MQRAILSAAALAVLSCALLVPDDARACGGFFCSGGNGPPPVVQTGEKILFAAEGNQVTAHVQILYQGDPREFAWVVPTPSLPTIEVGSDQVFTIFDTATQPSFTINWTETCSPPISLGCAAGLTRQESIGVGASGGGVNVVARQPVGPYDTAILSATDPAALKNWLAANDFDLAPEAEPLIAGYVEKGDYFVALKLQSDKGTGDLQPVVLKYESDEGPCVPIRLTQVAALPDLGIAVFVLGGARAVPANYLHLEINEAKLDWMAQGSNYPQVVTDAANEAGGHGFVTDYAGASSIVESALYESFRAYSREAVATTDPAAFVRAVRDAGLLGTSQNVLAILNRCVPPAGGSTDDGGLEYYQSIESYPAPEGTVEQPACGDDIDNLVVKPLREVDALVRKLPKLTRLYTTMSPDEMTEDPIFTFNPDLPDVALARTISGRMICDGSTLREVEYTTSDGRRFVTPARQPMEHGPSLKLASEMHASGEPIPVIDNRPDLESQWQQSVGCGCAVAMDFSALAFAAALLALKSRRRN